VNAAETTIPFSSKARQAAAFCLDVVFPPVCVRCRRMGAVLCAACAAEMTPVVEPFCPFCGRSAAATGVTDGEACGDCRRDPPLLRQMRAPLRYAEPTDQIIHRLKYEGYFALAQPLARFLINGWPNWDWPPDLIIPIPLHPRRRRRRGYNQSELLARPLAAAVGLEHAPAALRRTRHTAPQVGLGPEARATNVKGAFEADPVIVTGRSIVLVDDVLTTGATMTAAAEALLTAGARTVSAYCLARVS